MIEVLLFREIEPDSADRCSGRCPWREGQLCSLFFVQLVPKTGLIYETDCQRSSECKTAEKRVEEVGRWKRLSVIQPKRA